MSNNKKLKYDNIVKFKLDLPNNLFSDDDKICGDYEYSFENNYKKILDKNLKNIFNKKQTIDDISEKIKNKDLHVTYLFYLPNTIENKMYTSNDLIKFIQDRIINYINNKAYGIFSSSENKNDDNQIMCDGSGIIYFDKNLNRNSSVIISIKNIIQNNWG